MRIGSGSAICWLLVLKAPDLIYSEQRLPHRVDFLKDKLLLHYDKIISVCFSIRSDVKVKGCLLPSCYPAHITQSTPAEVDNVLHYPGYILEAETLPKFG